MVGPESSQAGSWQRFEYLAGAVAVSMVFLYASQPYSPERADAGGDYSVRVDPKDLGGHVFGFTVTMPEQEADGDMRSRVRYGTLACPPGSLDGVLTLDDAIREEVDALNAPIYDCNQIGTPPADAAVVIGGAMASTPQG